MPGKSWLAYHVLAYGLLIILWGSIHVVYFKKLSFDILNRIFKHATSLIITVGMNDQTSVTLILFLFI